MLNISIHRGVASPTGIMPDVFCVLLTKNIVTLFRFFHLLLQTYICFVKKYQLSHVAYVVISRGIGPVWIPLPLSRWRTSMMMSICVGLWNHDSTGPRFTRDLPVVRCEQTLRRLPWVFFPGFVDV